MKTKTIDESAIRPDVTITEEFPEGIEVAAHVAKALSHNWEDFGIGGYEYWGAKGTDVRWEPVLSKESVWVRFAKNVGAIPTSGAYTYEGGGCDGEHRGSCKRCCAEVEVPFRIDLYAVMTEKGGTFLAEYLVRQE